MPFDDFDISIQCDECIPEAYQYPEASGRVYDSLGDLVRSEPRLVSPPAGLPPVTLWDDAERWEKAYHEMDTDRAFARREELATEQERDRS